MNGNIRCFELRVGNLTFAMPTSDIQVLHPENGKPNTRRVRRDTMDDGSIRLAFDLSLIFFPEAESLPTRAVVLAPEAVPIGLRRSFENRESGKTLEYVFLCDRIDREVEIPAALFRPLPKIIRAEGILGAFSRSAFFDGTAYPLLQAGELIENVIRFRRSLP